MSIAAADFWVLRRDPHTSPLLRAVNFAQAVIYMFSGFLWEVRRPGAAALPRCVLQSASVYIVLFTCLPEHTQARLPAQWARVQHMQCHSALASRLGLS